MPLLSPLCRDLLTSSAVTLCTHKQASATALAACKRSTSGRALASCPVPVHTAHDALLRAAAQSQHQLAAPWSRRISCSQAMQTSGSLGAMQLAAGPRQTPAFGTGFRHCQLQELYKSGWASQLPVDLTAVAQGMVSVSRKGIWGLLRMQLIKCLSSACGSGTTGQLHKKLPAPMWSSLGGPGEGVGLSLNCQGQRPNSSRGRND